MKKLFLTLCALVLLTGSAFAEHPTYTLSGYLGAEEGSLGDAFGGIAATMDTHVEGGRYIRTSLGVFNIAGDNNSYQSISTTMLLTYDLSGGWEFGVSAGPDFEIGSSDAEINVKTTLEVSKAIGKVDFLRLKGALTWIGRDAAAGSDIVALAVGVSVTPPL